MKKSLSQILIGYVFIFISIRIGIDLFAEPIGYLLIALACYRLGENFRDGKILAYLSSVLIFFSIPSVFIDFNLVEYGYWFYYSNALYAGEIVLTFYLFRLLIKIAEAKHDTALKERTRSLFNLLIPTNLLVLGLTAFLVAFEFEQLQVLAFVLVLLLLVLNIAFLLLINTFKKSVNDEEYARIE
jgi:hypothetical protein